MVGGRSGAMECPKVGSGSAWRLSAGPRVRERAVGTGGYRENHSGRRFVVD